MTAKERIIWLEDMLAYAVNLMSQIMDMRVAEVMQNATSKQGTVNDVTLGATGILTATSGPGHDPDRFDIASFVKAVQKLYPTF